MDELLAAIEVLGLQPEHLETLRREKEELETFRRLKAGRERQSVARYFEPDSELPELDHNDDASTNKTHLPISELVADDDFGHLHVSDDDIIHCRDRDSRIFTKTTLFEGSTEPDVHSHVCTILDEIIFAAKLESTLFLRNHLAISELKADFWIISYNGFPVTAIEIKKPGPLNEKKRKINFGQLFDYMQRIRSFHGVTNVFGIFTNWDEWTIAWLPHSHAAATATDLTYSLEGSATMSPATRRTLHISRTYKRTQLSQLSRALYSLVKKIARNVNTVVDVPLVSKTRSYIYMKETKWIWKFGLDVRTLSMSPPRKNTASFYLLRDFRGGADGRVWLACHVQLNGTANLAVIKFISKLREGDEKVAVDREVRYWHKLGMKSVYGAILSGRHAIVMPFGFHLNETGERIDTRWWAGEKQVPIENFEAFYDIAKNQNTQESLRRCITVTAEQKLIHCDIQWRHVAFFPVLKKNFFFGIFSGGNTQQLNVQCMFIDLTNMKTAESVRDAESLMLGALLD